MAEPGRLLPAVTADDAEFWNGGLDGTLRIQRCDSCTLFQLPPGPVCHRCLSREVRYETVSGRGTVYSYTINYQPWLPHLTEPFAIVVVELIEQERLRLVSRLVDVDVGDVHIGMPVRVSFDVVGEVALPYFVADEAGAA